MFLLVNYRIRFSAALWPTLPTNRFAPSSSTAAATPATIRRFASFTHPDSTAIFGCFANGEAVAYAQVSLRQEYVEGASSYPIAYLDALYIRQNLRTLGVGQRLVDLVTTYVNSLGIEELAADCLSSDLQQFELFLQSGFEEISQMTHFVKSIPLKMRRS